MINCFKMSVSERKSQPIKHSVQTRQLCGDASQSLLSIHYVMKPTNFPISYQSRNFSSNLVTNHVSVYLHQARLVDSIRLALRSKAPQSVISLLNDPAVDSFVITQAALSLIETLNTVPKFSHTQTTLHAIAKILSKSHKSVELQTLIDSINAGKYTNVAQVSFMDRLRWYAAAADLDSAIHVWNELRLALPDGKRHPCTESYNILMSLLAKKGKNFKPWLDPSSLAGALSDWSATDVSILTDTKFVWTTRLVCKMLDQEFQESMQRQHGKFFNSVGLQHQPAWRIYS